MFVGLVVNSGIIMFSEKFNTGTEWFYKVLGLLILENIIIVVYILINCNILPYWFNYLNFLKQLYDSKYYFRKESEGDKLKDSNNNDSSVRNENDKSNEENIVKYKK